MMFSEKQNWIKKGLIFKPDNGLPWSMSHAQVPVAEYCSEDNIIQIYYSTRDAQGRSLPGKLIVDADNPLKVLAVSQVPLLKLGKPGTFDDCGVMPSWVIDLENRKYLYYIGWNVRNTIPYHNSVGLAVSEDQGRTFTKFSEGPLWDRNHHEPYFSGTSCVIKDGKKFRNWYLSCVGWLKVKERMEPRYHIKHAWSDDGINWNRDGHVAIDFKNSEEGGIVKASVIQEDNTFKMWFAYRQLDGYRTDVNKSYRIGYAKSIDGLTWDRDDDTINLDVSKKGWDSQMLAYPHVIDVKGQRLMFYNGNGFGHSGFGYAILNR